MQIQVSGTEELKKYLSVLRQEEIPKAFEITINKTMGSSKSPKPDTVAFRLQTEIKSVFDRPTPWAVKGLYTDSVSMKNGKYNAEIKLKDEYTIGTRGTPAVKFLGPQVQGGKRGHKSHEMWMIRRGLMNSTQHIVPGPDAKIDKYGNQSRTEIQQALSALGAYTALGYNQNSTTGEIRGWKYFLTKDKKTVFAVKGGKVKIIWYIVDAVHYKPRFDYFGVGLAEADRMLLVNADYAIQKAIERR